MVLSLDLVPGRFAVCRLAAGEPIPPWATRAPWFSVTRTDAELSVICPASDVPAGVRAEGPWRAFTVRGPLDFDLKGVVASLAVPLADAGISVFVIATYDTDHLLVREPDVEPARAALARAGHTVASAGQ